MTEKTKEELIIEIKRLQKKIAELEMLDSERKKPQEAVKKSEEYFRAITENILDTIIIVDKKGVINYITPSIECVAGYKPEEIVGKSAFDFIHPADLPRAAVDFAKALMTKENNIPNSFRVRHKDGSERILEGLGKNLLDNPAVAGFVMNVRDITERKRADEALQRTKQQMEFILGATKTGLDIIDSDFNMVYIDPEWQKVYGNPNGKKCYKYFMGSNTVCPNCGIVKALKTKKLVVSEEVLAKEGNRPIQVNTIPFQDEKGNWLVAEVNVDITERKDYEFKILESQKRFQTLVETISDFIWEMDLDGVYTYCSPQMEKKWGFKPEQMIGKTPFDLLLPGDREQALKAFSALSKSASSFTNMEMPSFDSTGQIRFLEVSGVSFFDIAGKLCGYRGITRDITERQKAQEELRSSEEKFSKAFNLSPSAVFITTLKEGRFIEINATGLDMFGYKPDEIVGNTVKELGLWVDLNDRATLIGRLQKEGIVRNMEVSLRRKSGEVFTAIAAVDTVDIAGQQFLLSTNTDITERKQAEEALKGSEEELREEKLLLEQKNLALKELLEHMERVKNKTKEDIGLNVEGLIMPILKRLELKDISRKYTQLLRYHLDELVSSFGRKITAKSTRLSPKETEICSMLKGGLHSKEISELLNVSYQTIDKHRRNIRKKLAISKKKVNLTSFLQKL